MSLKIYNSLSHRKEEFIPQTSGKVQMYVCGITSYDECHLGHAMAAVTFDVIYRYLGYSGYKVTFVRNFTDVDDKIIKKANETGMTCEAIAEKYIASYLQAMNKLGVASPTVEPRASHHIPEMIQLVQRLESKEFAYRVGEDVVYPVRKFSGYGKLSHKKIDELESGARVEVNEQKKDPLDFVLWKGSKPGEPRWASPWGEGRPGWHIECSAMSMKYLGKSFDIHGGGKDLIFPHHENEIAQSEAATGHPFVRYWIHNGHVRIDQEKMSKSLGNFRTVPAMLERWSPEAIRFFLLSSHYRSQLNFTEKSLDEAEEALSRFYETLFRLKNTPSGKTPLPESRLIPHFEKEMNDDFNAAKFIGILFEKIRRFNAWLDKNPDVEEKSRNLFFEELQKVGAVLGLFGQEPDQFLELRKQKHLKVSTLSAEQIEKKIADRLQARSAQDFKKADEIRQELLQQGIELRDQPDGTTSWRTR